MVGPGRTHGLGKGEKAPEISAEIAPLPHPTVDQRMRTRDEVVEIITLSGRGSEGLEQGEVRRRRTVKLANVFDFGIRERTQAAF